MTNEQNEFIKKEARGEKGQQWLEIFEAIADSCYFVKGIKEEEIQKRVEAAKIIEKELVATFKQHMTNHKPQQNQEYL